MLFHGFSSSRYTLVEKLVSHWLPFGEVSFRPPFPTRPCEEGLCRSLPRALRERLQPIRQLRTEAYELGSADDQDSAMQWSIGFDSICWISNWSTTYRGLQGRLSLCTNMMLLVGVLHFVKSCWWYEIRREHENQKWDNFCEVVWLPYHGFYWSHLDSMVSPICQCLLRGLGCAIKAGLILSLRSSQSLFSTPKSIGPWQLWLKTLDSLWRWTVFLIPTLSLNSTEKYRKIQPCPSWTCNKGPMFLQEKIQRLVLECPRIPFGNLRVGTPRSKTPRCFIFIFWYRDVLFAR